MKEAAISRRHAYVIAFSLYASALLYVIKISQLFQVTVNTAGHRNYRDMHLSNYNGIKFLYNYINISALR